MNEVRSSPILNLEKSRSCLAREALGFGLRVRRSGPLRKADPEPMERDAGSGNGSRLDSSKRTQSKWDAVVSFSDLRLTRRALRRLFVDIIFRSVVQLDSYFGLTGGSVLMVVVSRDVL